MNKADREYLKQVLHAFKAVVTKDAKIPWDAEDERYFQKALLKLKERKINKPKKG